MFAGKINWGTTMTQINTQEPLKQLELILSPFGIKMVSSGGNEVSDFLIQRYGSKQEDKLKEIFLAKLQLIPQAKAVILGVPSDNGAALDRGSKKGPLGIRQQFLKSPEFYQQLEDVGVVDIGDVLDHPLLIEDSLYKDWVIRDVRQERWGHLGEVSERLDLPVSPHSILERTLECIYSLNPEVKVLLLGGDHSHSFVPVKVLSDARRNPEQSLGVLQVDAHTDLMRVRDGLPFSFATWAWHANKAIGSDFKMAQVGVRISKKERSTWEDRLKIHQHWTKDVLAQPQEQFISRVIDDFKAAGVSKLYISHDIDGISPEFTAATGTPEPDGLTPQFVESLFDALGQHFNILGSDLMEVAPALHLDIREEPQRTLQTAAHLAFVQIKCMLGDQFPLSNPFSLPEKMPNKGI